MALKDEFNGLDDANHSSRWDDLWKKDFVPWDKGVPNPALVDLLEEHGDMFGTSFVVDPGKGKRRKTVLVPGCGRGYDVLLFAAFGYDAYGLEISEKALEAAKHLEKTKTDDEDYKARDQIMGKGRVTWLTGDFFKDDFTKDLDNEGLFDIVYDHTFLSALPPSFRPAWSKRFCELLAPTGKVICLEFPSTKATDAGGPPWALPPNVYEGHLARPGEKLSYGSDGRLLMNQLGSESNDGLDRITHFQPKRSTMGIDEKGVVTDWISVWQHKPLV